MGSGSAGSQSGDFDEIGAVCVTNHNMLWKKRRTGTASGIFLLMLRAYKRSIELWSTMKA